MKYIVKNCPCLKHYDDIELDNRCNSVEFNAFFCENIPDCLIKRVIEKCKSTSDKWLYNAHVESFAKQILDMFEIERVKE